VQGDFILDLYPFCVSRYDSLSLYVGWSVDLDSICVGTVYGS
jgi:hypothetical protein